MNNSERTLSPIFERLQIKDPDICFISVGYRKCVPLYSGWSVPGPHKYVIHFNVGGRAILRYNKRQVILEKNDVFVSFPNQVYQFTADEKEPLEYVWLSVSGTGADLIMEHSFVSVEKPFARFSKELKDDILNLIHDEDKSCTGMLTRHQKLYQLFSCMVDQNADNQSKHHIYQIKEDQNAYLINAINYITKNFDKRIMINELAESLYISRDYLFKLFIKNTGMSPSQFITDYRINLSLQLLANKDLSISQISSMTGFCDAYHFSRTFKKIHGKSPTQYRKQLQR